ncbi:conserved exported hypothetical protein [Frankia sp. AiPs1]|uniref:hypothetical protein n=1 Tax=Frankia sp. AiPa1 TaxID=573492 RepID=UPI00202B982A|nr:hypothetical protein [Frankia sp. AiPa1]MCL9759614.1 hypothetical protein [Frankia sp. AiPa1]
MRLRRLTAVGATLLLTSLTSLGVLVGASPASADGYCPRTLSGWQIAKPEVAGQTSPFHPLAADGRPDLGSEIIVYGRPSAGSSQLLVQFRNTQANGKSNVVGRVGRSDNSSDLGQTGTIGLAPNGAWCSSVVHGTYIWSSLSYQAGGVSYGAVVSGHVTFTYH